MALASADSGGSAGPGIGVLMACGFAVLASRAIGSHARVVVPAAVFLAAVIVAGRSRTGILSSDPLSGPLQYTNADGAFYVQATVAGLMIAFITRVWLLRLVAVIGAGVFAATAFIIHAEAAAALVVVLPGIGLILATQSVAGGARAPVALFGILFVACVAATILLGATYSQTGNSNRLQDLAARTVDQHRLALWHDAFAIMRDHPVTGVGPGRFQFISPIALKNRDFRWAHNEFLQQGAEGGVPGLVLLAAIFVWGFARLWVVRTPDAITALSAASLAALGIHASVDYVMHFPAIPLMAAGLVATGMTAGRNRT
jgi:O-antigen ligase